MRLLPLLSAAVAVVLTLPFTIQAQAPAQSTPADPPATAELKVATFAGGCFWCMEHAFDRAKGVKKTVVGYTGGSKDKPTYEEVSEGTTGHAEAIEVSYDPKETTFDNLLDVFWKNIDPTAVNRQFADRGTQYRTAIFYHDDQEKQAAEASKDKLAKSGKFDQPIATQIVAAGAFFSAEEYHQEYYKKNPGHYNAYEIGSGRAGFLQRQWGKPANP